MFCIVFVGMIFNLKLVVGFFVGIEDIEIYVFVIVLCGVWIVCEFVFW